MEEVEQKRITCRKAFYDWKEGKTDDGKAL
jgi:hypothetical protein